MYVSIEQEVVLDLSLVVAVTGPDASRGEGVARGKNPPRTYIHMADGRVVGVHSARESVVRKIRGAHL